MATISSNEHDNCSFERSYDISSNGIFPDSYNAVSCKCNGDKKRHRCINIQEDGWPYFGQNARMINKSSFLYRTANVSTLQNFKSVGSQRSNSSQGSQKSDDSESSDYLAVGPVDSNKEVVSGSSSNDAIPYVTIQGTETTRIQEDFRLDNSGTYETLHSPQLHNDSKNKNNTLPNWCKWAVMILIFIGMSILIALASVTNSKTQQFTSIKGDMPQKSTFEQQKQDLTVVREILEMLKAKFLKTTDFLGKCVKDCKQVPKDGNYQSCYTCEGYVSCTGTKLDNMSCPLADPISNSSLVWDDKNKTCTHRSNTCQL
ncbi:uncharacterized protein LOC134264818 [Saccostrea cucullata]|uniref:uncharacterized protein LOC134264818 n=1 Tax=Saccostrea cuccullata TaxID=36930 RepID=UPI002ED36D1F